MRFAFSLVIVVIALAGCVPSGVKPTGVSSKPTHSSSPVVTATVTPTPTAIQPPAVLDNDEALVELATQTVLDDHAQDVCDALHRYPDTSISTLIAAILARYGIDGMPAELQDRIASDVFVQAAATTCPEESDRVTEGVE